MDWAEHGFKTGRVTLPGLEIAVDLAPNQWFRDDGLRFNLGRHKRQLEKESGLKIDHNIRGLFGVSEFITGGMTYVFEQTSSNNRKLYVSIMVARRSFSQMYNVFRVGHESTHVLISYGKEKSLVDALRQDGLANPFRFYNDEEQICDIGGIFALHRRGITQIPWDRESLFEDYFLVGRR